MPQALQLAQKQCIIDEYFRRKKGGATPTQATLASSTKDAQRLDRILNQSTMSQIIKNSDILKKAPERQLLHDKRTRWGTAAQVEYALYKWICSNNNNGVVLTRELIKMYAKQLLETANKHLKEEDKI